jgi:hypothetical protein
VKSEGSGIKIQPGEHQVLVVLALSLINLRESEAFLKRTLKKDVLLAQSVEMPTANQEGPGSNPGCCHGCLSFKVIASCTKVRHFLI